MSEFDAVMLSFDEPMADVLHRRLERVLGRPVKRLHGVRGMRRAYELTAEVATTSAYLLADGDFWVEDRFTMESVAPLEEGVSMRVWQARNPLNGLVYGYGGLKLVRRSDVRQLAPAVDVLAAVPGRVEFAPECAGVTRIDQSPYHAWKAGFRECAMLSRGSEYGMSPEQTRVRLDAWLGACSGPLAKPASLGAAAGVAFATAAGRTRSDLERINDPDWLRAQFDAARAEARS